MHLIRAKRAMHFIGLNAEKKGKIAVTSVVSGILKSVHAWEYVCWKIKRDGFNEYLVRVVQCVCLFYRLEVNVALAVLLKLSNLMFFPFSSK